MQITTVFYPLIYAALFFSFSAKHWFNEIVGLNLAPLIYILFTTVILINIFAIFDYFRYFLKNLISFDGLLILTTLISIFLIDEFHIQLFSFLGTFILFRSINNYKPSHQESYLHMLQGIFLASIISLIGVLLGLIELSATSSTFLLTEVPADYPNFVLSYIGNIFKSNAIYQFSGLQYSVNYTAYMLIAGHLTLNFIRFNDGYKNIIRSLFIICLILTQAKVSYLYISSLLIFRFYNKHSLIILLLLSAGYLFMTHIAVISMQDASYEGRYIHDLVYKIDDTQFYLNLFGWLKFESFNYYLSNGPNLNDFISKINFEPHSIIFSALLLGGLPFAISITLYLSYLYIKFTSSEWAEDRVYQATFFTLILETFVWDCYDAPIFWALILLFFNKKYNNVLIKDTIKLNDRYTRSPNF